MNDPSLEKEKKKSRIEMNQDGWICLLDGKSWSRLLYPNPVCFLSTTNKNEKSVMVLSWLTAMDNTGGFILSMNENRHTASILASSSSFVLSVPVHGMESLIQMVGKTSTKWGSKFPQDYTTTTDVPPIEQNTTTLGSHRKRKKMQSSSHVQSHGIAGLNEIYLPSTSNNEEDVFGIDGCVAHLQCHVNQVITSMNHHHILQCQVQMAHVRTDYWDSSMSLFTPTSNQHPPYLSFLGSQQFATIQPINQNDT